MENQVPEDVVKDRFGRLLALVQEKGRENSSRFQGTIQEILVEDENREKGTLTGRTQHNLLVHFPGEKDLIGKYVKVSLDTCKGFYYFGHIVEEYLLFRKHGFILPAHYQDWMSGFFYLDKWLIRFL